MKYIDADLLRKEIERRMEKHWDYLPDADSPEVDCTHNELCELGAYKELEHIEDFLNSLQQEQPEVELEKEEQPKIDWENEIEEYWGVNGWCKIMTLAKFKVIARYFIGLALNTRKEESK